MHVYLDSVSYIQATHTPSIAWSSESAPHYASHHPCSIAAKNISGSERWHQGEYLREKCVFGVGGNKWE